ncbi:MAG: hypothetical protein J6Y35_03460 [Bacteroidales bacterium]|nr:hypothetical protein [Bacteroidales bacterium]
MKYYQYFLKILLKYKWVLLATVGIPVVAAVLFCKFETPLYESETEIYPLVMKKDADMLPLNPCYQVQRIVHSRQFRQMLIDSKLSGVLCEKNYDRRVECHETPRHTLVITVRSERADAANALANRFLCQLDFATQTLTSVQMETIGFSEQIPWDYYHHQVDFVPHDPIRERDFDSPRYHIDSTHFCFDVLTMPTMPTTPVYPPDLLKTTILVFIISAFLSFTGVCIFEEIRNRSRKTSPVQ